MATSWNSLDVVFIDMPPSIAQASADDIPLSVVFLDLPPPNYGAGDLVPEAVEWTFEGGSNVTWYYGNTAYDTVLERWVEWHTWYDPDPEGFQYPGAPENWKAGSYSFYVISIEGL